MKNKLSKKSYLEIILFVVTLIVVSNVLSNWEHFKIGLGLI